jgi:hypothetical protein
VGVRRTFVARGVVAMVAFAAASCEAASSRTAVTLRVTSDLDCHRALTVRAQWFAAENPGPMDRPLETIAWVHGGPFSATTFPAEWTLHPRDAGPRERMRDRGETVRTRSCVPIARHAHWTTESARRDAGHRAEHALLHGHRAGRRRPTSAGFVVTPNFTVVTSGATDYVTSSG